MGQWAFWGPRSWSPITVSFSAHWQVAPAEKCPGRPPMLASLTAAAAPRSLRDPPPKACSVSHAPHSCAAKGPSSLPTPQKTKYPPWSIATPSTVLPTPSSVAGKVHPSGPSFCRDTFNLTPGLQGEARWGTLSQPPPGNHLRRLGYYLRGSCGLRPGPVWVQLKLSYLLFERELLERVST